MIASVLLAALSLFIGQVFGEQASAGGPVPPARNQEQRRTVSPLTPGAPVQLRLVAGDTAKFDLSLHSGEYGQFCLYHIGTDIELSVLDPGDVTVLKLNPSVDTTTLFSVLAETSGTHHMELHALGDPPIRAQLKLELDELRSATSDDRSHHAGERAFWAGELLRTDKKVGSAQAALNNYEQALEAWKGSGETLWTVATLAAMSDVLAGMGQYPEALEYLNKALVITQGLDSARQEAQILNELCSVHCQESEHDKALTFCGRALDLNRTIQSKRVEAIALHLTGRMQYSMGKIQQGQEHLNQALALWRALGDHREQAETLLFLGFSFADLSEASEAESAYTEALRLRRSVGDRLGEAATLRALGHIYSNLGEKQNALNHYDEAGQLFELFGNRRESAKLLNGMGQIYLDLGRTETALEYFNRALSLFRELGVPQAEGITLVEVARCNYLLGRNDKALELYHRALAALTVSADQRTQASVLSGIGRIYESFGDIDQAFEYYERALAVNTAVRDPRETAYDLNDLGLIHFKQRKLLQAVDCFEQALLLNRQVGDQYGESLTLFHLAQVERERQNLAKATARIEDSLRLAESLRAGIAGHELRSSYSASVHDRYEYYVELLMTLQRKDPSGGYSALAFQASERARARSLLDSLAEAGVEIRRGIDPALLERERALKRKLNAEAQRQEGIPVDAEAERRAVSQEIGRLALAYEQLQALIRSRSPEYAGLTQPRPLSLSQVQENLLDEDTILLEYALGEERSYLWAVSKGGFECHELPQRSQIREQALRLHELLTARQPRPAETVRERRLRIRKAESEYWQEASQLSQLLLGPVASKLSNKRIVVVGEDAISSLPFAALPEPRGEDVQSSVPLIVEHEVVRLPSASVLTFLRTDEEVRPPAEKWVAVFADPVFDSDDPRVKQPSDLHPQSEVSLEPILRSLRGQTLSADGAGGTPRLPATLMEAEAILALVPAESSTIATGFMATRSLAMDPALSHYRWIHFATHAVVHHEHPELSGVILSMVDKEGNLEDGSLRLHDIYNLNLPAELVVLSACDSATGKWVKGEGLVSLVRGFMYAGASRVVASLWKVDDQATKELMVHFYRGMVEENLSAAAALRQAQLALWNEQSWRSPFFWGAFVLQGEWR
ncbi:MAG TPA: CHAT domain-containing protein [Acidobacteriota bacterium]|nr:CHAT domain-containing protein [Acidobacteriota bacterium]